MSFLVSILVTDLIQDEDLTMCPYHLRHLERRAAVTSCIPSLAHNSMVLSSWGLMPQIHQIIDLSFLWSHCKSEVVGAQVSLPWRRAERTQASTTFPWTVRDMCLDVRIGRSILNFPQAVQHLVIIWQDSNRHQSSTCHQDNRSWLQHQAEFHLYLLVWLSCHQLDKFVQDTLGKHSRGLLQFCPGYPCTSYAPRACTVSTQLHLMIQHCADSQHMEMHQSHGEHKDPLLKHVISSKLLFKDDKRVLISFKCYFFMF